MHLWQKHILKFLSILESCRPDRVEANQAADRLTFSDLVWDGDQAGPGWKKVSYWQFCYGDLMD